MRGRNKTKKSGRDYFTSETDEAIIKYNLSTDARERAELYIQKIEPAFDEMVDKIVFTYKFTTLPNIDSLRSEC